MARVRADVLLVQRGYAESRQQARRLIQAGHARASGEAIRRPADLISESAPLAVESRETYLSRGGLKLEAALRTFTIDVTGLACLDIGASTGGFTDCLLQHGAASVLAVDVGHGQLHPRLAADPRVTNVEGVNARSLPPLLPLDFFVADLSFISLAKVLPSVARRLPPAAPGVALLKPQFEAGPLDVPSDGVITDPAVRERVCSSFVEWARAGGWSMLGLLESPVAGGNGNVEFLVHLLTPRGPVS